LLHEPTFGLERSFPHIRLVGVSRSEQLFKVGHHVRVRVLHFELVATDVQQQELFLVNHLLVLFELRSATDRLLFDTIDDKKLFKDF